MLKPMVRTMYPAPSCSTLRSHTTPHDGFAMRCDKAARALTPSNRTSDSDSSAFPFGDTLPPSRNDQATAGRIVIAVPHEEDHNNAMASKSFSVRSARFPAAYGTPGEPSSLLPWSYVEGRIRDAANYWITTVGPDARPHARPVDGVWVEVHLSSEAEAIILEGTAQYVTDASHPLTALSTAGCSDPPRPLR